jgi:hypothetical protein
VKALLGRSPEEGKTAPMFVFDAGYDPVKPRQGLEGSSPCQILVRLRAGRGFHGDPSLSEPPANIGRPRRHGPKMKCNDPSTWPDPDHEYACEDGGYGAVRVRAWSELHPKLSAHEGRGSRGPLPIVVGTLVLVEVERLPRGERRREPRVLWLWWDGPEPRGRSRIWACSGAPTRDASTWNTPSASSSKRSDGAAHGFATPSRRTYGRGWWWRLSRSYAWRDRAWRT